MNEQSESKSGLSLAETLDRLMRLAAGEAPASFRALVEAAGLDPAKDFVGASLRELDFRDEDLRGFDFSFADLEGADFRRTAIAGVRFVGAALAGATGLPAPLTMTQERALKPGDSFREDPNGPTMVVVPAGRFRMGSPEGEGGDSERPLHDVMFERPFAIGKYAVTVDEFEAFVAATGHETGLGAFVWKDTGWVEKPDASWRNPGFEQTGRHPVTCVNWHDATAYVRWLSELTGKNYRLPSEAQWEYACRAGTATPFSFGEDITPDQANYNGNYPYRGGKKGLFRSETVAAGSLPANLWGLYEMHGNVWEWCADAWHENYEGAPIDGSVWESEGKALNRVVRGGSWFSSAQHVRSAYRSGREPGIRYVNFGFRCARVQE